MAEEAVAGVITRGVVVAAATAGVDAATAKARALAGAATPTATPPRDLEGAATPTPTPPLDHLLPIAFGVNYARNRGMKSWIVGTAMMRIMFLMLAM